MDTLGASAIDNTIGLAGNALQNRQNRKAAERQRTWTEDRQREQRHWDFQQWQRENQYNSPIEQMARFKEAGLNPHLIYGKGTAGQATPLRSPDIKPYSREQAQSITQGLSVFGDHQRLKNLEAQTDNLDQQTKTNKELQITQAFKNVELAAESQYAQEKARANLDKLYAERDTAKLQLDTLTKTQQDRIETVTQNLKNLQKSGKNLSADYAMKQFEIELNKVGLTKSDAGYYRLLRLLMAQVNSSDSWLSKINSLLK